MQQRYGGANRRKNKAGNGGSSPVAIRSAKPAQPLNLSIGTGYILSHTVAYMQYDPRCDYGYISDQSVSEYLLGIGVVKGKPTVSRSN